MSLFASLLMRISPIRCNIMMRPEATAQLDQMNDDAVDGGDGDGTKKKKKAAAKVLSDGDGEKVYTEDGYEILERSVMYLPDPRITVGGHGVLSAYWYGAFLLCIAWVIWNFMSYTPEHTFSMPMMQTIDPTIPISVSISCTSHTYVELIQNFTSLESGSGCLNTTSVNIDRRFIAPATSPSSRSDDLGVNFTTKLCYAPESVYSAATSRPPVAGLSIRFDNISVADHCIVDVFSGLGIAPSSSAKPIKRLIVESGVVKTFWMGYSVVIVKHDDNREKDQTLLPIYYELDGMRFEGSHDDSSVVVLKLVQTANVITQFDMRTASRAWGMFGSVWYLAGYPLFWMTPLVIACFPRDFFTDAKEHKIDGYTDNVLAAAWKPSVYIGTVKGVVERIKHAVS